MIPGTLFCILPFVLFSFLGINREMHTSLKESTEKPVIDNLHGTEIIDPFRYLEDQNSTETRAWIENQMNITSPLLEAVPGKEERIKRLTELLRTDMKLIPTEKNGRYFFRKRKSHENQYSIYMRESLTGEDKLLVDPHPMSPDDSTSVEILDVTNDANLLAFGTRTGGEDEIIVRFLNVRTGKLHQDELPKGRYYGISFTADGEGLYYAKNGACGGIVLYHKLGTPIDQDQKIFDVSEDKRKFVTSAVTENGHFLVIHVMTGAGATEVEIYSKDLRTDSPVRPVIKDIKARFMGMSGGDTLYIQTNWKAPNGRIIAVDLNNPDPGKTREIIPEAPHVIEDFGLVGGKLIVTYLENALSRIKVFSPDGTPLGDIPLPAPGTTSSLTGNWEGNEAFFAFTSFHIPSTIYRYDTNDGSTEIWSKPDIPVDPDRFRFTQEWYASKDGTRIPVFIVHKKELTLDGDNPLLLTGYGGFGLSMCPYFSPSFVLFMEHGGVIAIPNLRGGGEFGHEWHKAGMRENKQNVFDDFIAAAEYLIARKYTSGEKLAISGRSNGGLLVGACLTQRPDLFRAVVCGYPLLDMIRYHHFLVAKFWVPEYGSSDDPEQFRYILEYSPYHRIVKGTKYPAVLFITGDADTRVDPLHARKMTALLQEATGSSHPVLLLYDTKMGHIGARPVSKQVEDINAELSFLFWQLGFGN